MHVSSAIYIVMPIVIMAALGVMITPPFVVDSYSRRRSRRPLPQGAGEAPRPSPAGRMVRASTGRRPRRQRAGEHLPGRYRVPPRSGGPRRRVAATMPPGDRVRPRIPRVVLKDVNVWCRWGTQPPALRRSRAAGFAGLPRCVTADKAGKAADSGVGFRGGLASARYSYLAGFLPCHL